MVHQQYGHLLFDAIRETLENMAFAEVVPYSMQIGDQEFLEEARAMSYTIPAEQMQGWGDDQATSPKPGEDEAWRTNTSPTLPDLVDDAPWGIPEKAISSEKISDEAWANPLDAWGESLPATTNSDNGNGNNEKVDFEALLKKQVGWCWSCLKVNSPELHSVWFVVPQELARELAKTMYAGEEFEMDNPVIRDIVAELANVLGGRLMLLLEELIGKFTLEVPLTGVGIPTLPEYSHNETVVCKVLVDGAFPVLTTMCFRKKEPEGQKQKSLQANIPTENCVDEKK